MQQILSNQLVQLHRQSTDDAIFVMISGKSTFIQISEYNISLHNKIAFYASPTPLCGNSANQYNPAFIMAVLSVTALPDQLDELYKIPLPKVLFETHPDIRRSMTLNAMRMSTELFAVGSRRVYQLAQQRLEAKQADVVHDLLVYLMHAILDIRREYEQELNLRAESIAAYLGIDPQKVLLLMRDHEDEFVLAQSLKHGFAGKLQRQLNVAALVNHQMELLTPYQQTAVAREKQLKEMISEVLRLWENY